MEAFDADVPLPAMGPGPAITPGLVSDGPDVAEAMELRLLAVSAAARFHGLELDRGAFRREVGEAVPSPASLVRWLRDQGLVAKAVRVGWRQLFRLQDPHTGPVTLLLRDGTAGLLVGADPAREVVWVLDPRQPGVESAVAVDRLRLAQVWDGEALLMRRARAEAEDDKPFTLGWLLRAVGHERRLMRDVGVASLTMSMLAIIPPLLVMSVVDRVVGHRSVSTLVLLSTILLIAAVYETLLGYARRELIQVVSARLDSKLNLHMFARLLALPLDYFERNQAGQTTYRLMQIWKVRDFITGKLLGTFLDTLTLVFLLPFLFWMDATLAWLVLAAAGCIALIIVGFIRPIGRLMAKVQVAEAAKGSVLVETVQGVKTVKSLALEPQRKATHAIRRTTVKSR